MEDAASVLDRHSYKRTGLKRVVYFTVLMVTLSAYVYSSAGSNDQSKVRFRLERSPRSFGLAGPVVRRQSQPSDDASPVVPDANNGGVEVSGDGSPTNTTDALSGIMKSISDITKMVDHVWKTKATATTAPPAVKSSSSAPVVKSTPAGATSSTEATKASSTSVTPSVSTATTAKTSPSAASSPKTPASTPGPSSSSTTATRAPKPWSSTTTAATTTTKKSATAATKTTVATTTTKSTAATTTTKSTAATTTTTSSETLASAPDCDPPAYHEFPEDIFGNRLRARGAVLVHILVGIYMFYALAVVCDQYFVASMAKICEKMGLSEDVAGATFMAAGSSAPELFASVLGVFVAKGDVGTGTIVGSAVFNVLFVIGFCAIFSGRSIPLNWWSLIRDSFCYTVTVVVLIIVLADGKVTWLESLVMLLLYVAYILIMKFNFKIRMWLTENTQLRNMDEMTQAAQGMLAYDNKQIRSSYVQFSNDVADNSASPWKHDADISQLDLDEIIRDYPRKMSLYEAAQKVMTSRYFRPRTRFRSAAKRIIIEHRHICREGYPKKSVLIQDHHYPNPKLISNEMSKETREAWMKPPNVEEQGLLPVICWFIKVPVLATLHYTIPDCRTHQWEQWFLSTFVVSMIWIAFFSYVLVWMVTLVGYTFGIPDTIMGITFLAAGTSIPDAYASLLVAKEGLGDMAIANSIGSNVFDILIGLALPWFLGTVVINPSTVIPVSSGGLVYNVVLLFLSIIVTIVAIHKCHWQLCTRLGTILMSAYAVFLLFSLLIEFNVFGYVNRPECEE